MTEYQTLALQYAAAVQEYAELELHCRNSRDGGFASQMFAQALTRKD